MLKMTVDKAIKNLEKTILNLEKARDNANDEVLRQETVIINATQLKTQSLEEFKRAEKISNKLRDLIGE